MPNDVVVQFDDASHVIHGRTFRREKRKVIEAFAMPANLVSQLAVFPGAMSDRSTTHFLDDANDFSPCSVRIRCKFAAVENEHAFVKSLSQWSDPSLCDPRQMAWSLVLSSSRFRMG